MAALSADALQEAISHHEPALRQRLRSRFGASTLQHATDLDDVIQLVRLRLHELHTSGRLTLGTDEQLAALIYRIAHDRAIDAVRRERRLNRLSCDIRDVGTGSDSPAADLRDSATARDLQTIMRHLGRVDSEIFYLFAHGYGHGAIARIVGMSMQAYRSRWRRVCERELIAAL